MLRGLDELLYTNTQSERVENAVVIFRPAIMAVSRRSDLGAILPTALGSP